MCSFQKKKMTFLPGPYEEMSPHFKLHVETFSYFQIVLVSNINFLSNKQNRKPKFDPQMLKQYASIAIVLLGHVPSFTQTGLYKINKQINK